MNERIQELAQLAGIKLPVGGFPNYDEFDFEKFAELIAKECARVANDSNQSKNRAVGVSVGDVVKNHFGVE